MPRRIHMSVSIEGMMRNKPKSFNKIMTNDDGSTPSLKEAKEYLKGKIAEGWRVLPMSKGCIGFDKVNGCPGHEVDENGNII